METEKKKLTDNQLRLVQAAAGILCAAAILISLQIASMPFASGNILFEWLFVIVFVVILFGQRWIENKYRLRLRLFNLVYLDGIAFGLIIMLIIGFYSAEPLLESEIAKLLIIIGVSLVIIGLGVVLPLRRYLKRKEKGEVPPIRIPEKSEEEKENENKNVQSDGHSSIARQIAEMTKELEEKDNQDK